MSCDRENFPNERETELLECTIEALELLYAEASHSVSPRSSVSLISAMVVLMTLWCTHGVSNTFVDELLYYVSIELLPTENVLPKNHYIAKKMLQVLGLSYNIIYAYPLGCVLF